MVEAYTQNEQSTRWKDTVRWKNISGETVPAFGCVQVNSYVESDDYFEIIKPTWNGTNHFFNGPVDVADGEYGESQTFSRPQPGLCQFLYTSQSQIPWQSDLVVGGGTQIGPWNDSWEMRTGGLGYRLTSGVSLDSGIATVEQVVADELYVFLDEFLEFPGEEVEGAFGFARVQFLSRSPGTRAFFDIRDETGSIQRRPVWSHYHKASFPDGLFGKAKLHEGRLMFEPIFKGPIVVLKEPLEKAVNRFDDNTLPSAIANYVRPSAFGGWEVDPTSEVRLFNRGKNVSYEAGLLGTYDFFLGKLQFIPLDCPEDPEEDSEQEIFIDGPRI